MNDLVSLRRVEIGNLILSRTDDEEISSGATRQDIFPASTIKNIVALASLQNIAFPISKNLVVLN